MDQISYCPTDTACQLCIFLLQWAPSFSLLCTRYSFSFFFLLGLPGERTPHINSYCCANKSVFLFSPLLIVNLVEQPRFRALREWLDSAQIKHCEIISRLQRWRVPFSSASLCNIVLIWKMLTNSSKLIVPYPPTPCKLGPHAPHRKSRESTSIIFALLWG